MPRFDFQVVGDYGILRSAEYDSQDTVNMYIVNDSTAKKPTSLQPMAGRNLLTNLPLAAPVRDNGMYRVRNTGFIVSEKNLYTLSNGNDLEEVAQIDSLGSAIAWANSPQELAIVDDVNLYSYNLSTGDFQVITAIQAVGFPVQPQMIYYQDSRFILSFKDSAQYFYSSFATTTQGSLEQWDPSNYFIQQSRPDLSVGISGANERLFLFGQESVENWAPYTTPNLLPFYRDNNFIYEFGSPVKTSIVKGVNDSMQGQPVSSFVGWLATNNLGSGCFVMTNSGTPIKVSSEAVDLRLSKLTNLNDCVSTVYKIGAHIFIENTFRTDQLTLVLDVATGKWFRKERLNGTQSLINSHMYLNGTHYVGSATENGIFELSDSFLMDNDENMRRARSTITFTDSAYKRICGNMFEVDFEAGNVEQGENPVAYLSISYDGGRTYGNARPTTMGKIGKYRWKAQWYGLGTDYNFTFKIEVWDAVRVFILGGAFDYETLGE